MSEPFIAEVRIWGCNYAPRGWAFCDGGLLPISQNTALFSLIGTTYGGDGRVTFALPNLKDSIPVDAGNGPGLTPRELGESGGSETVTLDVSQVPGHSHSVQAISDQGTVLAPAPDRALASSGDGSAYFTQSQQPSTTPMAAQAVSVFSGGGGPHNNLMPYLGLNFCISLTGIFPPRT